MFPFSTSHPDGISMEKIGVEIFFKFYNNFKYGSLTGGLKEKPKIASTTKVKLVSILFLRPPYSKSLNS